MLEEVGEPYNVKILDLALHENRTPDFLEVNPMGRVPVLCHNDKVITESAAICFYLAETFPNANLCINPNSPHRADYLRWMFYAPASAETAIIWRAMGDSESGYKPYGNVEDVVTTLSNAIGNKEFMLEDRFTAVDILIGCTIMWGLNMMQVLPKDSVLSEYWQRLEQRPAWKRSQLADQTYLQSRQIGEEVKSESAALI